ncbi:MAG: hypothetical protein COW40_05610 [Cytophagales bacterium CG17_big_fil_post_rev_8_21_14_2_50_40_13]|nr:MAG: hypothetical protein COW40_05610 [Cytophagales bacterium CG17_big_fil_post_rev_8_21_14_2_50_40_13]
MQRFYTLLFISVLSLSTCYSQVVKIREYNSNNELIEVSKPYIIDINGRLSINIDKAILLDTLIGSLDQREYPSEMLELINQALRLQQKTLMSMTTTGSREERLKALDNFRDGMAPLLIYLVEHQDNLAETQFYKDLEEALGKTDQGYKPYFQILDQYYEQVTSRYTAIVSKSSVKFKLGGWLNTEKGAEPFHIEGFDSISSKGIIQVPRFATSIPQSEVDNFNEARKLADSLQNNTEVLIDYMKKRASNTIDELKTIETKLSDILDNGLKSFESRLDSTSASIQQKFRQPVNDLKQSLNDFRVDLAIVKNDVQNITLNKALDIAIEADSLIKDAGRLKIEAEQLYKMVTDEIAAAPSIAQKLKSGLTSDISNVQTQIKNLATEYLNELKASLAVFNESNITELTETAAKFTSSTFALGYNDVPASTILDVRTVGQREVGDEIYFKATIVRDSTSNAFDETVFWQKYSLFHIGLNSSIRASLIFADKVNGNFANTSNDFQLAPSYSAIFKIGSRKSMFYNKYFTPGLGVNVSTLDFNNDNTPEIGIGLTAAFFKDYLQIGYGRNMATDDNFWLFGLRLPLFGWATTGIESAPSSTAIQSN